MPPVPITLLQYNVLIDSPESGCVDDHMKSYANAEELEWTHRCEAIAKRVRTCAPDVALLEEVSVAMFVDLRGLLSDVYDGYHAAELVDGRVSEESHSFDHELAIFVCRTEVEVIGDVRGRRLVTLAQSAAERELLMIPSNEGDAAPENYAVLTAAVRHHGWPLGERLVVGVCHLRWEYGDMPAAKGKPVQAICAGRALLEHAYGVDALGVALCGDFNSSPQQAACAIFKGNGGVPRGHEEHPGGECGDLVLPRALPELAELRSAYAEAHGGAEPLFTRKKETVASQFCLDYVFVGGRSLRVASAGFGPEPLPYAPGGDGSDLAYLPNADWPSDHLPLCVQVYFDDNV